MRTPALAISPVQTTLLAIKKNLAGIKTVTSNSFVLQQQQVVVVRKQKEEENRRKKESKTEAFKSFLGKKTNQLGNAAGGKGSGILDYIKNFASFVFWGFLLKNLLPHLPKLKAILPLLSGFFGFLEGFLDLAGNVIVNFIDAGYKAYDSVRGLTKSIGGEKFQKTFDDFSKHFNTFLNLAIFGGLAAAGTGIIPKVLGKVADKGVEKVATSAVKKGAAKITTSGGRVVSEVGKKAATSAVKKGAAKITTSGGRVVSEVGKKAAPKFLGRAGKFGAKALGKTAPVIGPLINFGIRVWSGDNPGRAAAGSVGMGVGQAIGGTIGGIALGILGSAVPFLGNAVLGGIGVFIGQVAGGLIGEWIGDSLYDLVNKKPTKVEGRAKGGQITRNGVPVGGKIRRGVRPQKQRLKKPTPKKSNPGRDVGGIKKIEKLFPNPENPKKKNPLKTLKYAATAYNTIPGVGRLLRAGVEGSFGERPDKNLIKDFSADIGTIVQNVVNGQINTSSANILAMASGGLVPERTAGLNRMNVGEQVSTLLAKSLDVMMNNQMNRVFQNIMKQYDLEDFGGSDVVPSDGSMPASDGSVSSIDISGFSPEDVDALGRMIAAESAGESPLGKAGVMAVILNRYRLIKSGQVSPGAFNVVNKPKDQITIRDILFAGGKGRGNQFSPYADGNFDKTSSTSGAAALAAAIAAGGNDPNKFKQNLIQNAKMSEQDADYVVRSISFSNPNSRGSRPFNTREVRVGNHVFQQSPNAQLRGEIGAIAASVRSLGTEAMVEGGKLPSTVYMSSPQGWRKGRMHKGVDLVGSHNAPISTAVDATVIQASDIGDKYGKTVVLRYANGSEARFAHLNTISVRRGQKIKAGTVLGTQGNTGASEGEHLHFEYYPRGGAMTYQGYGDAAAAMNSLFRYGGNVRPRLANKPKDVHDHNHGGNTKNKNQFDVLIPLDHVKDKSLIGDPRYPKASDGAEEQERQYQEQAAAQVKANLERSGLRVKIMKPEDYGSYAAYDAFIRRQSAGGAITVPIHLDAVRSAGGKGALTRIRAGDAGDRALATKINPVLQRFASKHGLSYGGMDTESNRTVNQSGNVGAATLIELGVQAELRRKFGPNFMQSPEVKQLLIDLSNAIRRGVKPKGSGTAARISAIPTSSKIQAQSIARYDTTTERTTTVVAYQQVIQQQLTPVPVKSGGALFLGDRVPVNNNSQYQSLGIA